MSISLLCDLRSQFGKVRDQGTRPTCLAFAATDAHGSCFPSFKTLSVEYLYYNAVQLMPARDPNSGITSFAASESLAKQGQPLEVDWPYQSALHSKISAWKPPENCSVFKRLSSNAGSTFDKVRESLDSGKPVVICLRPSSSFYRPESNGLVAQKTSDPVIGNHAVIAVGHGRTINERCLLIRNSWGVGWGLDGYAFLEEGYLSNKILSAFVLN